MVVESDMLTHSILEISLVFFYVRSHNIMFDLEAAMIVKFCQ